jgi:hypothetical protein
MATAGFGAAANAGTFGNFIRDVNYARAAASSMAGGVSSYAASRAIGVDASFSWRSIAANAVSAAISTGIGDKLGWNPTTDAGGSGEFWHDMGNGMLSGAMRLHTSRAMGIGDDVDYRSLAADAFGNALGNAAIRGIRESAATEGLIGASKGAYGALRDAGYSPEEARALVKGADMQKLLSAQDQRNAMAFQTYGMGSFDDLTPDQQQVLLSRGSRATNGIDRAAIAGEYQLNEPTSVGLNIDIIGGRVESEKSSLYSFGVAASGVIMDGQAALGRAIETVGEQNVRGAIIVTQFALGGIPKTIIGLGLDSVAGEWVNSKMDQYLIKPLSSAYAEGGFGAHGPDEIEAVRPASELAAQFTVGMAASTIGVAAASGREMIIKAATSAKSYLEIARNRLETVVRDGYAAAKKLELVGSRGSYGSPGAQRGSIKLSSTNGGGTASPAQYPDGISYRTDLPEHLAGPHGFTNAGKLHGTHNMQNALDELRTRGLTPTLTPTSTPGIFELSYPYTKPNGAQMIGRKTVYDPSVISDSAMLRNADAAGRLGYEAFLKDPSKLVHESNVNGVKMRSYMNQSPSGDWYVGNAHPID